LPGVAGDGAGRVMIGAVGGGAGGLMGAHGSPPGLVLRTDGGCRTLVGGGRVVVAAGPAGTVRAAAAAGVTRTCTRGGVS